jgi:hypothetical protein
MVAGVQDPDKFLVKILFMSITISCQNLVKSLHYNSNPLQLLIQNIQIPICNSFSNFKLHYNSNPYS